MKNDLQANSKNLVISQDSFNHTCEELFSLMEYLNDFLTIRYEPVQRLIRNVIISFFLMPLIRQSVIDTKSNTYKPNGAFLLLYFFITKLEDLEMKLTVSRLFFQPFFDSRFSSLIEYESKALDTFSYAYSTVKLFDPKDPLCAKQLESVYEKVCSRRLGSMTNNSLQELIKQKMENLKLIGKSSEKQFHHYYSQRTGIVSFIPWEQDLDRISMTSPFDLIDIPSRDKANEVRRLVYTTLEVNL
jgi:hypothetical protein